MLGTNKILKIVFPCLSHTYVPLPRHTPFFFLVNVLQSSLYIQSKLFQNSLFGLPQSYYIFLTQIFFFGYVNQFMILHDTH